MRHLFFDLDGTLTDPKEGITACIRYAQRAVGAEPSDPDALTWCIGPPLLESLETLVGAERAPQALVAYRERFSDVGWRENQPYAGIHAALEQCRSADASLFVATSKPRVYARAIIEHFGLAEFFTEVFGAELDGTRSNKAELLAYALNDIGSDAPSLMVGDRRHDVAGALANGITPIGVSYGYGSRRELEDAGAACIVDAPSDLPAAIARRVART